MHTQAKERAPERSRKRRRVRLLAAIGVLAIMGVGGYYYFFLSRPIGDGPAGPPVPKAPFERVWSEQPVLLLGLGDSVTAGYGASPGMSYFERLVENPEDEFPKMEGRRLRAVFPNLMVRNAAVSGSTSIGCLEDQLPKLKPAEPEVLGIVVITTGGNDLIHMYGRVPPREAAMYGATLEQARPWIANFETRLGTILSRIEALFPGGCHLFLATIYDPSDGVGDPAAALLPPWPDCLKILGEYNRIIKACAEARPNVHLVDVHAAMLGHGVHCTQPWNAHYDSGDPHYWYYENLEDPNDRGYDAIRRVFLNAMVDVLALDGD